MNLLNPIYSHREGGGGGEKYINGQLKSVFLSVVLVINLSALQFQFVKSTNRKPFNNFNRMCFSPKQNITRDGLNILGIVGSDLNSNPRCNSNKNGGKVKK